MKKTVTFNTDASEKLIKGINTICDSVKQTLGAGGRVVLIEDFYGNPRFTKDGVSVAKEINLSDPIENMGAQLIKQVAIKTVNESGDGTTTACVLAQAIINKGIEAINNGENPISLIESIKLSTAEIVKNIRSQSVPIKGDWERVKQVAVISTNGDEHHASLLIDAMQKVGEDGVVMIEQGTAMQTKVDVVKGIEFESGYLSPFFANNAKNECVLENPFIFVTTGTISYMEEVIKALEAAMGKQRPILFISNNADGEGFASLMVQRTKGNFPLCIVNAPSYGDKRKEHLIDIATATGGSIFGTEFGKEMKLCKEKDLGQAEKVIITKDKTIIIGGAGNKEAIEKRMDSIKTSIANEEDAEEKAWFKSRLAKLSGGVAIMKIGGITQVAISELKDRCDDALCATKAAIEEGIVPGGGVAYLNAVKKNKAVPKIITKTLEEPFKQIMRNAGFYSMIDKLLDKKYNVLTIFGFKVGKIYESNVDEKWDEWYGMNVRNGSWESFLVSGVIDPTKVVVSALENAVDIACLVLQNNVVITNIPEEKRKK